MPPHSPGSVWNRVHYAAGLRSLGHDVHLVEEVRRDWCVDDRFHPASYEDSTNRRLFRDVLGPFGLLDGACQLFEDGEGWTGLSPRELEAVARDADLLINISGHVRTPRVLDHVDVRAYVDDDPVYTQLWVAEHDVDLGFGHHDVFFTKGLDIGTPRSPIPDAGVRWHPLLPAVHLDHWEVTPAPRAGSYTTIASWSGYKDLVFQGELHSSKYHAFQRFAPLASRSGRPLEVLLKSLASFRDDVGVRQLREHGWIVSDSAEIDSLEAYQQRIRASRGEIGIAKDAYVRARSGWFSDRAAHYLAAGRPVLAQATGFEEHLPTGTGILTFGDLDEAAAGLEELERDHAGHCRAAREFAEAHLDHRQVLTRMLDTCSAAAVGGSRR